MNKKEINKAVYVTGTYSRYQVINNLPGQETTFLCQTDNLKIAFAVQNAIRQLAYDKYGSKVARSTHA